VDVNDVWTGLERKQKDCLNRRQNHPKGPFDPFTFRGSVSRVETDVHSVVEVALLFGDVSVDTAGPSWTDDEEVRI
jgi:hypothetical protein